VHADGTGYHAHALIEHACPMHRPCMIAERNRTRSEEHRRSSPEQQRRRGPVAHKPNRASDERVSAERHEASARADADTDELPARGALRPLSVEQAIALGYPIDDALGYRYFWSQLNQHMYRCRDRTASTRMYQVANSKRVKVWNGGYFFPFVCDYVGAPLAFHFFEARVNEAAANEASYRELQRMLDGDPVSVTVDKGLLTKAVYEHNTRRGVATIGPDRRPYKGRTIDDLETPEYDRFGPRCKHCGGPGRVNGDGPGGTGLEFRITGTGDPRINFRCQHPHTPDCQRVQSISCSREWRLLCRSPATARSTRP
jgi:hypothetical protein